MPKGIAQRLLANLEQFLEDYWMQRTNSPVDDHLKLARSTLSHSLAQIVECGWQINLFGTRGSQIQHQFTPFEHHLVRLLQGFFKDSSRRLVFMQLGRRRMETQQQTLDSLKK